jgi:hypothetical protein
MELNRLYENPIEPCTGNAYICRVARKLWPLVALFESEPRDFVHGLAPWNMDAESFATLVANATSGRCTRWVDGKVRGLLEAVEENPSVCPILADALQDAGCDDAALLEALRTP